MLVGGPGADTVVCGAGVDMVVADATDKVAADCEKVTGLPKPALSLLGDVSQPEGNGPSTFSFTVTLAEATRLPVTVAYATADGTATAGSDYTAASGKLTFAPGETSKTIAVPIIGDTVVEADERRGRAAGRDLGGDETPSNWKPMRRTSANRRSVPRWMLASTRYSRAARGCPEG